MAKKISRKKASKKSRASPLAKALRIFMPSWAKVGWTLLLVVLSMLYNGNGLNYYKDPVMRGFPLAILTLEESVVLDATTGVCLPAHYQLIFLSLAIDIIFFYLLVCLLHLAYGVARRRRRHA